MDSAMVACFPTPVDAQGEVLLLKFGAAARCYCNPPHTASPRHQPRHFDCHQLAFNPNQSAKYTLLKSCFISSAPKSKADRASGVSLHGTL
jgi:hypothetical protein